ncbi:MAG: DUF3859 domain-containing protein [Leptospiraceae bacterium]|nr:DUF3859 domain-containing protein [Leptospiraceae bacterium]
MRYVTLLLILILLLGLRPLNAPEPKCEIYDYGLYEYTRNPSIAPNDIPNSRYNSFDISTPFLEKTKTIPAIVHTRMAFKFRIKNLPKRSFAMKLRVEGRFPMFKDVYGRNFDSYKVEGDYYVNNGMIEEIAGYSFDEPEELSIGTWTFSIWHKSKMLCSMNFEVVPP